MQSTLVDSRVVYSQYRSLPRTEYILSSSTRTVDYLNVDDHPLTSTMPCIDNSNTLRYINQLYQYINVSFYIHDNWNMCTFVCDVATQTQLWSRRGWCSIIYKISRINTVTKLFSEFKLQTRTVYALYIIHDLYISRAAKVSEDTLNGEVEYYMNFHIQRLQLYRINYIYQISNLCCNGVWKHTFRQLFGKKRT
jgi:hypothetical protein